MASRKRRLPGAEREELRKGRRIESPQRRGGGSRKKRRVSGAEIYDELPDEADKDEGGSEVGSPVVDSQRVPPSLLHQLAEARSRRIDGERLAQLLEQEQMGASGASKPAHRPASMSAEQAGLLENWKSGQLEQDVQTSTQQVKETIGESSLDICASRDAGFKRIRKDFKPLDFGEFVKQFS